MGQKRHAKAGSRRSIRLKVLDGLITLTQPKTKTDVSEAGVGLSPSFKKDDSGPFVGQLVSVSVEPQDLKKILDVIESREDPAHSVSLLDSPHKIVLPNGEELVALTIPGMIFTNPLPQYPIEIPLIRRFNLKTGECFFYEPTPRQFDEFSQRIQAYLAQKNETPDAQLQVPEIPQEMVPLAFGTENQESKLSVYLLTKETKIYLRRQSLKNKLDAVEQYYHPKKSEETEGGRSSNLVDRIFYAFQERPAFVNEFEQPLDPCCFKPPESFYRYVHNTLTRDALRLDHQRKPNYRTSAGPRSGRTLVGLGDFPDTETAPKGGDTPIPCQLVEPATQEPQLNQQGQSHERVEGAEDSVEQLLDGLFVLEKARVAEESVRQSDHNALRECTSHVPTLTPPPIGTVPDGTISPDEWAQRVSSVHSQTLAIPVQDSAIASLSDDDSPVLEIRDDNLSMKDVLPDDSVLKIDGQPTQGVSTDISTQAIPEIAGASHTSEASGKDASDSSVDVLAAALASTQAMPAVTVTAKNDDAITSVCGSSATNEPPSQNPLFSSDKTEVLPRVDGVSRSAQSIYRALKKTVLALAAVGAVGAVESDVGSRKNPDQHQQALASNAAEQTTATQASVPTIDDKVVSTPRVSPVSGEHSAVGSSAGAEKQQLDVLFAYDSAERFVDSDGKPLARDRVKGQLADFMKKTGDKTGDRTYYVSGYASTDGNEIENQKLSERRAKAKAALLCEVNSAVKIEVRGLGETNKFSATELSDQQIKGFENLPRAQRINHVELRKNRRGIIATERGEENGTTVAPVYSGSCQEFAKAVLSPTNIRHVPIKNVHNPVNDPKEGLEAPDNGVQRQQDTRYALTSTESQENSLVSSLLTVLGGNVEETAAFLKGYLSSRYQVEPTSFDNIAPLGIFELAKTYCCQNTRPAECEVVCDTHADEVKKEAIVGETENPDNDAWLSRLYFSGAVDKIHIQRLAQKLYGREVPLPEIERIATNYKDACVNTLQTSLKESGFSNADRRTLDFIISNPAQTYAENVTAAKFWMQTEFHIALNSDDIPLITSLTL